MYDPHLSPSFTAVAEEEQRRPAGRQKGDFGAGPSGTGEGRTALGSRWGKKVAGRHTGAGDGGGGGVTATSRPSLSKSAEVGTLGAAASALPRHAFISRAFRKDALWAIRFYAKAAAAGHVGASIVLGISLFVAGGAAWRRAAVPRLLRAAAAIDIADERHTRGNDALRPQTLVVGAANASAQHHHHILHMPHLHFPGHREKHALVRRRAAPLLLEREKPFFFLAQCFANGGSRGGGIDRDLEAAVAHYERFIELHPAINKVNGSIHAHMLDRLPRGEIDNINTAKRNIILIKNQIETQKKAFSPKKLTPYEQRMRLLEERRAHHNALCKAERLRVIS